MSRKSIKVISVGIIFLTVLATLIYEYISSGSVLEADKISYLKEAPIAHRGLFDESHPENSLAAFENAIQSGYPIELDVQFTKDEEIVVFHDENLERITGYNKYVGEVKYEEIKKLNILGTDEKIPRLKDVLDLVDGRVPIIIEIKDSDNVIELSESVYNITKNYSGKYAIQSFNPFVLEWYKNNAREVVRGQLSGTFKKDSGGLRWYEKFALENLMLNYKSRPNYIAYELDGLPHFRVSSLRRKGILTLSWTVGSQKDLEKANRYSDNIIFDSFIPK